eukprot:Colp12_sorted_trinity150504_noHs@33766
MGKVILTSKSIPREHVKETNARLAVLGEKTLAFFISEHVFARFPTLPGNCVSDLVKYVMSDDRLIAVGNRYGINRLIVSMHRKGDPTSESEIGEAMLAAIGGLYMTKGMQAAKELITKEFLATLDQADVPQLLKMERPKLLLRDVVIANKLGKLEARILNEAGRHTHFPTFTVGIFIGGKLMGEGTHTSIRRAEIEAVREVLAKHFVAEVAKVELPSDITLDDEEWNIKILKK